MTEFITTLTAAATLESAVAAFIAAALLVWWAGSNLPRYVLALCDRTGLGKGVAGMLVLGGITSLPELATATSAAAMGAPLLSLNNILGSASFNILLLALADMVLGARPLTSVVARPVTLIQGVLGVLLLGAVGAAIVAGGGERIGPVGAFSTGIVALCVTAIAIANRSERRPMWQVVNPPDHARTGADRETPQGLKPVVPALLFLAALILAGGFVLAASAEVIARKTGLGDGVVGFLFAAAATSLPELSAIVGSMRCQRYELAVGEVFGSNLFNLAIIFVVDLAAPGPPVLRLAGNFEALAALLALGMTGIFVLGLIERRNRTFIGMGEDSLVAMCLYAAGTVYLFGMPAP